MTASAPKAKLATAGAGQKPDAPGAWPAVHRRNSTVSPDWEGSPSGRPGPPGRPRPRPSPYSRPGVTGRPPASTAVIDGTMAETATARASGRSSSAQARRGPSDHAWPASCSMQSAEGTIRSWGILTRASMAPSGPAATALTAVVPMSIPTVTSPWRATRGKYDAVSYSSRPRALVTAPLRGAGMERLGRLADVVYDPWIDHTPLRIYDAAALAARVTSEAADVIVVEADSVKGPVLELPLRAIASTRGDPNNVDIPAATAAGIPVLRTPGRNADAVAEMVVALLFAVSRHVLGADADVRAGQVFRDGTIPYQRFRAWEMAGRTAGLVGLGAVGQALRWRLEGLGMTVLAHDPYNDEAKHTLDEVLAGADVVSMHAPVTEATTGMIGPAEFARMRDGVIFLNAARAQLHDHDALVAALGEGKVAGAGLDHFVGEVLATDDPLTGLANVVLTPHIGGATWDTEARQAAMVADDLDRLWSGQRPRHIVNPEVLGR